MLHLFGAVTLLEKTTGERTLEGYSNNLEKYIWKSDKYFWRFWQTLLPNQTNTFDIFGFCHCARENNGWMEGHSNNFKRNFLYQSQHAECQQTSRFDNKDLVYNMSYHYHVKHFLTKQRFLKFSPKLKWLRSYRLAQIRKKFLSTSTYKQIIFITG